jgi:hypothetical protein
MLPALLINSNEKLKSAGPLNCFPAIYGRALPIEVFNDVGHNHCRVWLLLSHSL